MKKLLYLGIILMLGSCNNNNHCGNGVQDGDETGVDCGGSCVTLCPTTNNNNNNPPATSVCPQTEYITFKLDNVLHSYGETPFNGECWLPLVVYMDDDNCNGAWYNRYDYQGVPIDGEYGTDLSFQMPIPSDSSQMVSLDISKRYDIKYGGLCVFDVHFYTFTDLGAIVTTAPFVPDTTIAYNKVNSVTYLGSEPGKALWRLSGEFAARGVSGGDTMQVTNGAYVLDCHTTRL